MTDGSITVRRTGGITVQRSANGAVVRGQTGGFVVRRGGPPGPAGPGGPLRVVTAGNLGAAYELDVQEDYNVLLVGTLNANNALTFTNLGLGSTVSIVLTQDATGGRTLTIAGSAVAVNPTAASVTVIRCYSPDGSTVYVDAPGVDPPIVGAEAHRTTAQSAANNSFVVVTWEAEGWDTNGFVNLGTNNTRITIPTGRGGLYAVSWITGWAINATGMRSSWVRLNNASYPGSLVGQAIDVTTATGYVETPLVAGDYLEMVVYQNSGGALNLQGGSINPWPRLTVRRLGPTP